MQVRRGMSRLNAVVVAVAVALVTAGCGGPQRPLSVGLKEYPSDIVLKGQKRADTPAPLPPVFIELPAEAFVMRSGGVVPPVRRALPREAPEACPEDDPLQGPKLVAANTVRVPPVPATYTYRSQGTYEVTGANAAKGELPPQSTRQVANVVTAADESFTFDVIATLGDESTTTSYRVSPNPTAAVSGPEVHDGAGMFITKIASGDHAFTPDPPMLLLPFPAEVGESWRVTSRDPATNELVVYNASIGQKSRVNACGTPLDAISVHLDGEVTVCPPIVDCTTVANPGGTRTQPTDQTSISFVGDYAFGTHYGGIALRDHVTTTATESGQGVTKDLTATIDREPERAA
jgi:hypothetical protein